MSKCRQGGLSSSLCFHFHNFLAPLKDFTIWQTCCEQPRADFVQVDCVTAVDQQSGQTLMRTRHRGGFVLKNSRGATAVDLRSRLSIFFSGAARLREIWHLSFSRQTELRRWRRFAADCATLPGLHQLTGRAIKGLFFLHNSYQFY